MRAKTVRYCSTRRNSHSLTSTLHNKRSVLLLVTGKRSGATMRQNWAKIEAKLRPRILHLFRWKCRNYPCNHHSAILNNNWKRTLGFSFQKAHVAKVVEWLIAGLRGGVQSWLATPSDLLHCWHIGWRWSGGGHSRELIFEAFCYRSKLVNMHNPAHQFVDYSFDFPCNPVKSSSDFDPYTSHYKSN